MIKSAKKCDVFSTNVQFLQGFWPNLLADFWQNQVLDPNNVSLCKPDCILLEAVLDII